MLRFWISIFLSFIFSVASDAVKTRNTDAPQREIMGNYFHDIFIRNPSLLFDHKTNMRLNPPPEDENTIRIFMSKIKAICIPQPIAAYCGAQKTSDLPIFKAGRSRFRDNFGNVGDAYFCVIRSLRCKNMQANQIAALFNRIATSAGSAMQNCLLPLQNGTKISRRQTHHSHSDAPRHQSWKSRPDHPWDRIQAR